MCVVCAHMLLCLHRASRAPLSWLVETGWDGGASSFPPDLSPARSVCGGWEQTGESQNTENQIVHNLSFSRSGNETQRESGFTGGFPHLGGAEMELGPRILTPTLGAKLQSMAHRPRVGWRVDVAAGSRIRGKGPAWPFPGRPEGRAENHGSFCFEALWKEEHLTFASPGKGLFVIGRFTFMGFLAGVIAKPPGTCPGNNRSPSLPLLGMGLVTVGGLGGVLVWGPGRGQLCFSCYSLVLHLWQAASASRGVVKSSSLGASHRPLHCKGLVWGWLRLCE